MCRIQPLSRRLALRALGGAALALPLIGHALAEEKHAAKEEGHGAASKGTQAQTGGTPSEPRASDHGAPKGGGKVEAHWGYEGEAGPENWANLSPEYAICRTGRRQTPIDIMDLAEAELANLELEYQDSPLKVVNNGHTIQANVAPGSMMTVGKRNFQLVQFHFHAPSEHAMNGRRFEMELHLVHKDEWGHLGVLGVWMKKGERHPALQTVWEHMPRDAKAERQGPKFNPKSLLPADLGYYRYSGSLTTPPCAEGVSWYVCRAPISVGEDQIRAFTKIFPMNARPIQKRNDRPVVANL
jgi:carbonic anhydrase